MKNHHIQKVDVLIGGPPCQAYSIMGRSRDPNRMEEDPRNYLYHHYVSFMKTFNLDFFIFENVPGIRFGPNNHACEKHCGILCQKAYRHCWIASAVYFSHHCDHSWQKRLHYFVFCLSLEKIAEGVKILINSLKKRSGNSSLIHSFRCPHTTHASKWRAPCRSLDS
jgi:site-specific DNA-cytosine methylase